LPWSFSRAVEKGEHEVVDEEIKMIHGLAIGLIFPDPRRLAPHPPCGHHRQSALWASSSLKLSFDGNSFVFGINLTLRCSVDFLKI